GGRTGMDQSNHNQQKHQRKCARPAHWGVDQNARIARASSMSLARRALAWRSRRLISAASSCAPRMRPSLATKLAASSRACSTTLSSPEVLPELPDDPAEDAPAEVPPKLEAVTGPEARTIARSRVAGRIIWV